jgi:hypothetical protein
MSSTLVEKIDGNGFSVGQRRGIGNRNFSNIYSVIRYAAQCVSSLLTVV